MALWRSTRDLEEEGRDDHALFAAQVLTHHAAHDAGQDVGKDHEAGCSKIKRKSCGGLKGCRIFVGTKYRNGKNIPNEHKMAIKYTNGR
jgi:hypothetical protein